jgi:hypothetical protein
VADASYASLRFTVIPQKDEPVLSKRRVEPEWLDLLPAHDSRAARSRRDLARVNRIMGHGRILGAALRRQCARAAPAIAELGAGDGTLLLRAIARRPPRRVVLVDRQPVIDERTRARYGERGISLEVHPADVFDWLRDASGRFDAIVANLFLHHFEDGALSELLSAAARRTDLLVACEPRRGPMPLAGSRMLGLLGCNDVTRHDAFVSVRAGFRGRELSALWPREQGWALEERRAGLFSHYFSARRSAPRSPA